MRRMLVSAALLLAVLSAAEAQDRRWAVVEFSVDYMREEPDYAAENGDQALMGTVVEITGEQGYWRRIVTPEPYTAWVTEMGLVEMSGEEKDAFVAAPKYICISDFTYIYEEPSVGSGHLSDLVAGCLVRSVLDAGGRPLKKGKFLACALPSGKRGWVFRSDVQPFGEWLSSRRLSGENLVSTARRFLGVPYMWGGTSIKGVDCSGLVRCVYFLNGVLLPRNASQQAREGVEAPLDSLEAGDLLFFGTPASGDSPQKITHVGIYEGGGRFIHSSQIVRESSLDPSDPDCYDRQPLCARRIIASGDVRSIAKSPYYTAQSE